MSPTLLIQVPLAAAVVICAAAYIIPPAYALGRFVLLALCDLARVRQ